jgi:hypothetical protein
VRVFDVPLAEAFAMIDAGESPPSHLANALVIEWFNPRCGEFRFETTEFRLTGLGTGVAIYGGGDRRAGRKEIAEEESEFHRAVREDGENGEWDEFRSEQLAAPKRGDDGARAPAHERYGHGDEAERIIAHLMGWQHIEEYSRGENADRARPDRSGRTRDDSPLEEFASTKTRP